MTSWTAVHEELARWTDLGRCCALWLRDDDAVAAGPQLDRLLQRCAQANIPLGLAVIPADAEPSLAQALAGHAFVTPLVHGWSHADHAAPGRKKCEFGPERPPEVRQAEAERGLSTLRPLFGRRLLPLFVPPWNRMAPDMPARLAAAGYRAVSAFGPAPAPRDGIAWVNTHLDLIDWRGSRSAVPLDALLDLLCRELRERREGRRPPGEPIGLLTHHRVHDAAIWDLLDRLLDRLTGHPALEWPAVDELV
ncbi:polysaccharide deacetylase family protein [Azospirillum sp. YIM B02556]|uniref:Polysaccharide deacetylase family protein n=1 Tax=Azospirillum endophyticum TaxID=2800326 RepID=A0ABS1F665_9PROT|nr:polysaccharide deacetylase family protein [Azospirillum endophyticum]MBK1838882.1 polysaccharide deacetylase family protein [Azospirillum endophyticum]